MSQFSAISQKSCASVNAPYDSFFFSQGNLFWTKTHQFQFVFRELNH
jgi:hypothetical protein